MTLSLELVSIKNNAKPNDLDENKIKAIVKFNNNPVDGERVNFYVNDYFPQAKFKDGKSIYIGETNRSGEVEASVVSSIKQKVVVVVVVLNGDSPPISRSAIVHFGESSDEKDISNAYPIVVEAIGENSSFLERTTYYRLGSLNVIVPQYKGIAPGDKITVHWSSNTTNIRFKTISQSVDLLGKYTFNLPRYLFVDCIGGSARIFFTVEDENKNVYTSASINLVVEAQSYDIIAPTVITGSHQVSVSYRGMHAGQTVKIRIWNVVNSTVIGVYKSETKHLTSSRSVIFNIPQPWLDSRSGSDFIINYSVRDSRHKHFQFSRALEIKN